ncbi:MAG: YfiR family protein [Rhodoferax sp.]|nr:YfiR family protein [Rhodoferax sp.]MCF8210032.1 YfiR family protein [Rhodoferax sp.]
MTRVWTLLSALMLGCAWAPGWAQTAAVSEVALKSALFFKLPQFVYRADESREQPLSVCLLGSSTYTAPFEKLAQSPIDGRTVKFTKLAASNDIRACDFVFLTQSESSQVDAILRRVASMPVVTVSEIAGFAKAGGMVELALGGAGAPVNILINRRAARQQNIEFNAQLLRLAKVVE